MARLTNRDKLLTHGLQVVHAHSLGAASVRDIVDAAGVPQGSFSNHFASKEAFALEIIEIYHADSQRVIDETLRNDDLPPLARLRAWIDGQIADLSHNGMKDGCLYGNFSAEASEHSDAIRGRILEIFAKNRASVLYCLKAAVKAGEVPRGRDLDELAGFVISSLQGAILMAKAERTPAAIERFRDLLFAIVLI